MSKLPEWLVHFIITFFLLTTFCLSQAYADPAQDPFSPNSVLSLDDVVKTALSHSPDVKSYEFELKSRLSRASQGTAGYYPTISFDSNYARGNYLDFNGPVQQVLTAVYLEYYTAFSSTLVLEDFGKRYAQVGEAKGLIAMAQGDLGMARARAIYSAAEAYFKVLQAQEIRDVNSKLQEASQKRMQQAKEFVRTGEKPKLEFLRSQTAYLSDHFSYLKAEQDLANATTHLETALGISNPPAYTLKRDLTIPPFKMELADAKALAYKIRPELVQLRGQIAMKQALVNEHKADRWPVLSSTGSYGWVDSKFPPGQQSWTLGMLLHWPLFDGNRLTHKINESVNDLKQDEKKLEDAILKTYEVVEQTYRSYQSAQERLEVAKQEATQAEEAGRLEDARYKVGLDTFLDVADSQGRLAQARLHQVQALTDLRISQSALKRAIGIEEP